MEKATNSDYFPRLSQPRAVDIPLYIRITHRVISPQIKNGGTLPPADLDLLRWRYESILLDGFPINDVCLFMPSHYQLKLRLLDQSEPLLSLHFDFTLLLARNLGIHSGSERIMRVAEILVMLWAYGSYFSAFIEERQGMRNFFDWNTTMIMRGTDQRHPNPYIHEIFHHLAHAQATQVDIGSLWGDNGSFLDRRLVETLPIFDDLISRDVTPAQHCTLIDLICRDIELHPPERLTGAIVFQLSEIDPKDPCLAFLTAYACGVHDQCIRFLPAEGQNAWEQSWLRIVSFITMQEEDSRSPSLLQLKAALWPMISRDSHELRNRAIRESRALVQLQRIFEYPVRCPNHHDHDGHILLDMFEGTQSHTIVYFPTNMEKFTKVPLKGRQIHILLALLLLPDYRLTDPVEFGINEECWPIILGICGSVKTSQLLFLSLLCDFDFSYFFWVREDMAAFSICIHKSLDLPLDQAAVPVAQTFVRRLDAFVEDTFIDWNRNDLINTSVHELEVAVCRLKTHLASVLIHGTHNKRMLFCARAHDGWSPATGWLPTYID
ncbi:hypothetical protein M408DRAFT_20917 [Serendipita vermifera MAFF 305830]|uniref:Uncharacterized protein n=1 Tax=Serendipita vermifera MAFF 305830 TaxID=933852 RepID=A0A0C3BHW3_SERVB|nr:hypothetical protein M408DRAFT_20917 [Serendipita vermifera MAFF 305830]